MIFSMIPLDVFAARLYSSGCELQGDVGGNAMNDLEFSVAGSSAAATTISTSLRRSGNSSCKVGGVSGSWGAYYHEFIASQGPGPYFFRTYLYIETLPSEDTDIIATDTPTIFGDWGEQFIKLKTTGALELWEDTVLLASYATPLQTGRWYRLEWYYDAAAGKEEIRLDGQKIMTYGNAYIGDVQYFIIGNCMLKNQQGQPCDSGDIGTIYYDDIAINDGTGMYQNSWPGEGAIYMLRPNAAGDTPMNCTSGSWTSVDETTPDFPETYCNLDGGQLNVHLQSPYTVGIDPRDSVALVHVGVREKAAGSGTETWQLRIRSKTAIRGGNWQTGVTTTHNDTTYRTNGDAAPRNYTLTSYIDPDTGCPWDQYGSNSLENAQIGILQTGNAPDIRIDMMWSLVEVNTSVKKPCAQATGGSPNDVVSTAASKSTTYKQTKAGSFWANALAADKLCIGTDTNCTTDWYPEAKCRLEFHRIIARPNFPLLGYDFITPGAMSVYNISTNLCDGLLSTASKNAGWVSTGYDNTNRYRSGSLTHPRVCQFMRLACDGVNVNIGAGVSNGPTLYPVSPQADGFSTTSTNQCSDGIDNDGDLAFDFPADTQCSSWSDNDEII